MSRQGLSLKEIAREHGCTVRTLQRYAKSGCDVQDPEAVKEFATRGAKFTPRKHLESKTDFVATDEDVEDILESLPPPTDQGAAATLKRLQAMEPMVHARVIAAHKTGRMAQFSVARDDYLKVADALRKYESEVEMAKRDAGELMPRSDALEALRCAADWMRRAFQNWISSEAPNLVALSDPRAFEVMADAGIKIAINSAFEWSQKSKSAVPEWAIETLMKAWTCSRE